MSTMRTRLGTMKSQMAKLRREMTELEAEMRNTEKIRLKEIAREKELTERFRHGFSKVHNFDGLPSFPFLFLRGGLRPALRPSINCGPMRNPDITKG